uniref:Putative uncharacterized protein YML090W n=1 Tax=Saccharomyces cerevisiae (strain ATCC 204508 / S288c) TaxID=559292 RepID=YMJ0_YEAST|nr:RecName: Full=Putative uncharacterized protein YML090W [Saccharomyces cerevisiae S288C]AAT93310.1 YML090W [Saccharomyces cerevisiae]CAA86648.1 unnamed protein product [Saccharomyces cerevisiae]
MLVFSFLFVVVSINLNALIFLCKKSWASYLFLYLYNFFFCEDEYKLTKNCVRVEAIAPFMMCLGSLGAILGKQRTANFLLLSYNVINNPVVLVYYVENFSRINFIKHTTKEKSVIWTNERQLNPWICN